MSHFTVMVVTKTQTEEELKAALQPFHEYECTGTMDQYVIFQDCHDEVVKDWNEMTSAREQYETMEEFAKDYHGYDIIQDGRIGRYTNPNKKWDWWSVGGRWSGFLRLKDGTEVDTAAKGDVDFAGLVAEAREDAAKRWDEVHAVVNHRDWLSWKYCREREANLDAARELYNNQQVVIDLENQLHIWDPDDFLASKEEYMDERGKNAFITFAILYDGKWFQRGEMGYWACVSDEDEDWDNAFHEILKDIPEDRFLTIVDCHI